MFSQSSLLTIRRLACNGLGVCKACEGFGWISYEDAKKGDSQLTSRRPDIQRCNVCEGFPSDDHALNYVIDIAKTACQERESDTASSVDKHGVVQSWQRASKE